MNFRITSVRQIITLNTSSSMKIQAETESTIETHALMLPSHRNSHSEKRYNKTGQKNKVDSL